MTDQDQIVVQKLLAFAAFLEDFSPDFYTTATVKEKKIEYYDIWVLFLSVKNLSTCGYIYVQKT